MLLSTAIIILTSLVFSSLFFKIKLPPILGMLLTGILLGPFVLNLIDPNILNISTDLRQIALIVILVRAGLSIELEDLKKIGRPAFFLAFIPATIELLVIALLAPIFFNISQLEAFMMGAVVAAVSPAVVVPRMIKLIKLGYGKEKKIPQMILASASIDDIYIIVIFMSLMQAYQGGSFHLVSILMVPISIVLGVMMGVLTGLFMVQLFKKIHMRDTLKVLIIFAFSFLFVVVEEILRPYIGISGLVAVMSLGVTILHQYKVLAKRLNFKFEKIWVIAEMMLFVLVGAAVNIFIIKEAGFLIVLLILIAIVARIIGVLIALVKTQLTQKEKVFTSISYMPKATVQAAIGTIPLYLGVPNGQLILIIAVMSIIITAPLGAILMDLSYKRLLNNDLTSNS